MKIFLEYLLLFWDNKVTWMKKGNNIQTAKIYPQCVTAVAYKNVPYQKKRNYKKETSIRGCSYGGELAKLGGLGHLGEISPSLRNSYKNIMRSYPAHLGGISIDFGGIPPR